MINTDWESTWELQNVLRKSHAMWQVPDERSFRNNCAHSDRRLGKTTALIRFIVERHLLLHPDIKTGVLVPTLEISTLFQRQFKEQFPFIRMPIILVGNGALFPVDASIPEIYAEEMLMIRPSIIQKLEDIGKFVCGVSTILRPVGIHITEW